MHDFTGSRSPYILYSTVFFFAGVLESVLHIFLIDVVKIHGKSYTMNQNEQDSSLLISVDRKLIFIVKKLLENDPNINIKNSNLLTELVLERHREYQRRNRDALQLTIENILCRRLHDVTSTSPSPIRNKQASIPSSRLGTKQKTKNKLKRKYDIDNNCMSPQASSSSSFLESNIDVDRELSSNQNLLESEYEQFAQQEDLLREQWIASPELGGTSMLNAGLRSRYMTMQREREVMVVSTGTMNTDDQNPAGDSSNVIPAPIDALTDAAVNTSTKTTTATNSNPKTKKKKRSSNHSERHESSSSSPFGTSSPSNSTSSLFTPTPRPKERYADLGGMTTILTQIRQLIEYPLMHPELFQHLGIDPPRGILLRGPPGCGKTHLANAIAGQLNVTYFRVSSPELVGGISGESESRIRDLFTAASQAAPSIVFLDELDAIAPKRGDGSSSSNSNGRGMEKRVVAQLLTSLDALSPENNVNQAPVMIIGATNRPDAIDPALRRAGRFDREIILGVPDEEARECILRVMTKPRMRLAGDFDFKILARKTPGFVGADLRSLTKEAAVIAINRIFKMMLLGENTDDESKKKSITNSLSDDTIENPPESPSLLLEQSHTDVSTVQPFTTTQLDPLFVTMSDFLHAIPHVQPSSKREGFATIPDVTWDNIGALQSIREELVLSVLEPIQHPERFLALGIPLPAGVLLYGPP